MRRRVAEQNGQVLPLFALMSIFVIGVVALSIDYGFLSNQHRNLQAFADEAALAGAQQLNPLTSQGQLATSQVTARKTAFIYVRSNILCGGVRVPANCSAATTLPLSSLTAPCFTGAGGLWAQDISNCPLPAPLANYSITICTPGQVSGGGACVNTGQPANTLSVYITESVSTSLARVFGTSSASVGGFSDAQFATSASGRVPFALYSSGCVTTGNSLALVAGDVYIASCGIQPQSGGLAAFCAEASSGMAGNIVYGPAAPAPPVSAQQNVTVPSCQAEAGGLIATTGSVTQRAAGQGISVPSYIPPPGYNTVDPTAVTSAAVNSNTCLNGSRSAAGTIPTNCFAPGTYSTITGIANNLNPGVYYITGDNSAGGCNLDSSQAVCTGVQFSGNTLNVNWPDVASRCWAAPNVPAIGTYTAPCPNGIVTDPTAVGTSDPQCAGSGISPLVPPVFTAVANHAGSGGNLDNPAAGSGTKYWVRVTASNAMGESTSTEQAVTVNANALPLSQNSINVTITAEPGATANGYSIYVGGPPNPPGGPGLSALSGNDEVLWASGLFPASWVVGSLGTGGPYPQFNATSCLGFRNVPLDSNATENHGVTFVLYNKARMCVGTCGSSGQTPTVIFSPYCSGYTQNPAVGCPWATSGPNLNDGAFAVYSTSQADMSARGPGLLWGMVGTVYAPSMTMSLSSNAQLQVVPGQVIARTFTFQSGSGASPTIYGNNLTGAGASTSPIVSLIH